MAAFDCKPIEGSDQTSFLQASTHLREVFGIPVCERKIQRVLGRIGEQAIERQQRESPPAPSEAQTLHVSAEAPGVPMRMEELEVIPVTGAGQSTSTKLGNSFVTRSTGGQSFTTTQLGSSAFTTSPHGHSLQERGSGGSSYSTTPLGSSYITRATSTNKDEPKGTSLLVVPVGGR